MGIPTRSENHKRHHQMLYDDVLREMLLPDALRIVLSSAIARQYEATDAESMCCHLYQRAIHIYVAQTVSATCMMGP